MDFEKLPLFKTTHAWRRPQTIMTLYLNFSAEEHDKPIYRIISAKRLIELFKTQKNVLVHPSRWEDPYENFVLKSKVRLSSGEITEYKYHENFYGQCWTLHQASDAMWRIYSSDFQGIRIKTTVRKLLDSLYNGSCHKPSMSCVIGKVQYLSQEKLKKFANNIYQNGSLSKENLFKSLLVKRLAFKHEREVRILYFDLDKRENGKLFPYNINPHDLIDQLMLDPRLTVEEANKLKGKIIKTTGYRGKIKRSLLYAAPKQIILNERPA